VTPLSFPPAVPLPLRSERRFLFFSSGRRSPPRSKPSRTQGKSRPFLFTLRRRKPSCPNAPPSPPPHAFASSRRNPRRNDSLPIFRRVCSVKPFNSTRTLPFDLGRIEEVSPPPGKTFRCLGKGGLSSTASPLPACKTADFPEQKKKPLPPLPPQIF